MKAIITVFSAIAFASAICKSHAAPYKYESPRFIRGPKWEQPTRPAVFDINLLNLDNLIRSCKGAEIKTGEKNMWITAAECLDSTMYNQIEVKLYLNGAYESFKFEIKDVSIHMHPDYDKETKANNYGLIKPLVENYLNRDLTLRAIELPNKDANFVGKEAGLFVETRTKPYNENEKDEYETQRIKVNIIDPAGCKEIYKSSETDDNDICVIGIQGKGINWHEVGLPLVIMDEGDTFKLAGIVSDVRPVSKFYGVGVRLTNAIPYLDWIQSV